MYVKDTKFERQQHEATGRHQGNIQRSLKGLHREQEVQARQKQRAKDEVARLNGLVPSSSASAPAPVAGTKPTFAKQDERKATLQDRKRQWEQLAAMGIAVPDGARGDMAMAGEWSVVSEKVVGEVREDGEFKPALNKGVHKRKLDEDEEEQIAAGETITKKKGWGQTFKKLPGRDGADDDDVEALFGGTAKSLVKREESSDAQAEIKEEPDVKREEELSSLQDIPTPPTVVFKKRKKIAK